VSKITTAETPPKARGDWDFVYATRFTELNAAIVTANSTPTTFSEEEGTEGTASYKKIAGTFGDTPRTKGHWLLTTGGSGRRVRLRLPDIAFAFTKGTATPVNYTDCTLEVTFDLEFRPTNRKANGGGVVHELRIKSKATGGVDVQNSFITIESYTSTPEPSTGERIDISSLFANWLNTNMDQFDHVFSEVVVDDIATEPEFQWLQPTALGYAVNDTETSDPIANGFMAIATMTEERTAPSTVIAPDDILPAGYKQSFLVSSERFLDKLMLPGMGNLFDGPVTPSDEKAWPQDYFDVIGGNKLSNNEAIKIDALTYGQGEAPVRATLPANRLSATMSNTFLTLEMNDLAHPYGILLNVKHDMRIFLKARLNDSGQFDLESVEDSEIGEVAIHDPRAEKTDAAKAIDWVLIFADIAAVVSIVYEAGRGWMAVEEGEPEIAEGGASASRRDRVRQIGPLDERSQRALDAAGGAAAADQEKKSLFNILWAQITSLKGAAVATMTTALAAKTVYEAYAEGKAQDTLPDFKDFGAKVMTPIKWNDDAETFNVTSVTFSDGFQALGEET